VLDKSELGCDLQGKKDHNNSPHKKKISFCSHYGKFGHHSVNWKGPKKIWVLKKQGFYFSKYQSGHGFEFKNREF